MSKNIFEEMGKLNPYTARVDRSHPSAFVFLIDQSGSMNNRINFGNKSISKSEAVADSVNKILAEIINRCTKLEEKYHYFDFSLIGYGGHSNNADFLFEGNLEGKEWVTPDELAKNCTFKSFEVTRVVRGVEMKTQMQEMCWMSPKANSLTPMGDAFDMATKLLDNWCRNHIGVDSYPPVVINITDGQQTDCSNEIMLEKAEKLKSLGTIDGNVLLFNIHLADSASGGSIAFPTSIDQVGDDEHSKLLFNMSSYLPQNYNKDIAQILNQSFDKNKKYKALGYNVAKDFVKMLNVGTLTNLNKDDE